MDDESDVIENIREHPAGGRADAGGGVPREKQDERRRLRGKEKWDGE